MKAAMPDGAGFRYPVENLLELPSFEMSINEVLDDVATTRFIRRTSRRIRTDDRRM